MDRTERAAAERSVIESAPVAVRVLLRAGAADERTQFQRQTLAELRDWECVSTWQGAAQDKSALRWFVEALTAALFPPTVATASQPLTEEIVALEPIKAVDPGKPLGLRLRGCNPLDGVVFAPSIR